MNFYMFHFINCMRNSVAYNGGCILLVKRNKCSTAKHIMKCYKKKCKTQCKKYGMH